MPFGKCRFVYLEEVRHTHKVKLKSVNVVILALLTYDSEHMLGYIGIYPVKRLVTSFLHILTEHIVFMLCNKFAYAVKTFQMMKIVEVFNVMYVVQPKRNKG